MGIHSWYARTAASLRSVKHIFGDDEEEDGEEGDGERKLHPIKVSFESAVPAFQDWSATWEVSALSVKWFVL